MIEFKAWPKIPRWEAQKWTITEKIDGTNACVGITEDGQVFAQSRNKILGIGKDNDNHGFAGWVKEHEEELKLLGPGYHYGEWWGAGIQRRYGMVEKVFSLFSWWREDYEVPSCCRKVPIVANSLDEASERIKREGSIAAPGYMNPEGLILYSRTHHKVLFKYIINKHEDMRDNK